MHDRIIPTLFLSLSTLAIAPFIVPAIAYQHFTSGDRIDASIRFATNRSPTAGQPIPVQFLFSARNDQAVSSSNCNCQVKIHDFRDRAIFHRFAMRHTVIDGKAAIATEITFPTPGSYTVILSGYAQNNEPFEIRFPVTAVNSRPTY